MHFATLLSDKDAAVVLLLIGLPVYRNGQPHSTPVWSYEAGSRWRSRTTPTHCSLQGTGSAFVA